MKTVFYFILLTIIFYSCSPKIGSTITSKQAPLSDTDAVLVLKQGDKFTNDGIEIGSIKSGDKGLSTNCTYFEIIDRLKQLARQNGANVIKIIEHKLPDRWSSCERLTAKIYRTPDIRKHEYEIEWTKNRKLTWEDFKGDPKSTLNRDIGAQTYCSYRLQSNYVNILTKTKIFVTNTFNCNLSWVRPDQKNRTDLLEHEQGHFDISEVYARHLRKKFQETKMTVFNINPVADTIFKEVMHCL